jgi:pyruvate,water dikinase
MRLATALAGLLVLGCAASPGDPVGLCAAGEAVCGANAACDPLDGACYCEPGHWGDPAAGCAPHGEVCDEAAARVGHSACVLEVPDGDSWAQISVGSGQRRDVRRVGKYLAPVRADAIVPTLFVDTNYYPLHYCLLRDAFAPLLPGFAFVNYQALVYYRATRSMVAGSIYEFSGGDLPVSHGFTVETPDDPIELLDEPEIYAVSHMLRERFAVGPLGYVPLTAAQQGRALGWPEPRVPVVIGGEQTITYEIYTAGTAYGRVRRYTAEQAASASGTFGWQDILVLETAPTDLFGVMAGVVTGSRQDVLSHLNVLAGRRGTPNVFVADPLAAFAEFDGQLVRLRATNDTYSVVPASAEEATAYWAAHRPSVAIEHPPDAEFTALLDLHDIPSATADERGAAIGRFGGKVTGLATLYATLDPVYQTPGFGIPVAHYLQFMATNGWEIAVDGAPQVLSFADTITLWLADPKFRSDSALRRSYLSALAAAMLHKGAVDPALRAALEAQIAASFGDPAVMVRFRSSSNVEDGLEFNGAGLYTSVSACALDQPGAEGPSACDKDKSRHSIDAAIKEVWASLWSLGAFEEREYYQIDHASTAMGVLVSKRYEDEQANGVAFTGNPTNTKDKRYTINVQAGEVDVVSPPAGVTAELDRLTIEDGVVTAIERAAASSLVPAGEQVLSDAQLRELGALLASVAAVYPVDPGEHAPGEVLLDLEFKFDSAGKLVLKQIRPFLPGAGATAMSMCL